MSLTEKAVGATVGTVMALVAVYLFFHFQAQAALTGKETFNHLFAAPFFPLGLIIGFYCAFAPVKEPEENRE